MTIDLSDGLDLNDIMQIMKWLNVTGKIKPDLHTRLLDDTNALLAFASAAQGVPWLLNFLPGGIGARIGGIVDIAQLVKALLEA